MKAKIEELETNSTVKILGTCIGASVSLRGVTSLQRVRRVILLLIPIVFIRRRNHFFQLLNVHCVNVVRCTEIHTTESLVPFKFELAIENLKSH